MYRDLNTCFCCPVVLDEEKRIAKRRLIEQNREVRRHKELSQMMAHCGWRIERPTEEERRLIQDVADAYFSANETETVSHYINYFRAFVDSNSINCYLSC